MVGNGEHIYIHSRSFRIPNISVGSDITSRFRERDTWMITGKAKQPKASKNKLYFALTK